VKAATPSSEITCMQVPALSEIGKDADGEMYGILVMAAQFTTLAEFVGASMNPMQIHECAQLAYDQYYWLTLAEFKQFIVRVKTSYYTSNKNLNASVLMEFLKEYTDERLAQRYEHFSQKKADTVLHPEAKPLSDEQMMLLRNNIETIAASMGVSTLNAMSEEEYQRIKAEKKKGKTLDEVIADLKQILPPPEEDEPCE